MGEHSKIEWTDHTFNPWWGCVRVSEACRNCYAETFAGRFGVEWGPQSRRKFFGEKHWNEPLKWHRQAEREGVRRRVFCASMADVFEKLPEGHPDTDAMDMARARLWALIEETPHLDWLLLTKRPENITVPVPDAWLQDWPANVWVGTTVENQQTADERIPHLLEVPARVRFLSCEPLLGPVDLVEALWEPSGDLSGDFFPRWGIHWVICGGESGPGARPMHPDWVGSLRDQCVAAGVAFHFKQWGEWLPKGQGKCLLNEVQCFYRESTVGGLVYYLVGKRAAGRTLDGRTWDEFPEVARDD